MDWDWDTALCFVSMLSLALRCLKYSRFPDVPAGAAAKRKNRSHRDLKERFYKIVPSWSLITLPD
jgi:hypothetical protein